MAEWMTVMEAAAYLKVSRATLFNYMKRGILPWYSVPGGRGRRLKREDLDRLLQSGGRPGQPDDATG